MRFDDVPAGRLLVQLNPNTVITGYAELTVPTEREVELAPDATLRVAVKDPAGELVTAWMRCVRADTTYDRFFGVQGTPATFVGFNGGVLCRTMEALPPGTWRFEASADGRRPASQDVDVVAGREVAVELVLALGEH